MKQIGYYIGAAAIALGAFTSCTLDAENYTEKSTQNFPKTKNDIAQGLAGIYQNLNKATATPQTTFLFYSHLASDEVLGGGGPNDKLMQAMDLLMNFGTDMTNEFFIQRYIGINRANSLLDALKNMQLNATEKAQADGEARFLRAYYYYELASMYGRIPLTITSEAAKPVQATPAQIWGQILLDLKTAIDEMPAQNTSTTRIGHVDKYAAEALLGRCWLFYTGMYCNGDQLADMTSTNYNPLTEVTLPDGSKLTKADVIAYIDDCVNNSGYTLVSDFRNLWAYTNRCTVEDYDYTKGKNLKWAEDDNAVNPESMFAIKFSKYADWNDSNIGYSNQYALFFGVRGQGTNERTFPFGSGWGAGPVSPALVNDWTVTEPNDVRMKASLVAATDEYPSYALGGGGEYIQETGIYGKKVMPVTAKKSDGTISVSFANIMYGTDNWKGNAENFQLNNINDLVLIRFAEVLLMQSELKEDVTGINRVRARAGLTPIAAYSLEALQNERRHELAFEFLRWNDIRRWHIAATALEKQNGVKIYNNGQQTNNTPHGGGYTARYNATAGFAKIPESQIPLAAGADGHIDQNPGWAGGSDYNQW